MFGWFESSNEEDKALRALKNKTGNLTRLLRKSAFVALIGTIGFAGESRAATASNGNPNPDKPLIEAVADDDIDDVLERAEEISDDERFTPGDLDDYADYNKLLLNELDGLVDRVQSATNQGNHERAVSILRTVQKSVLNMHKNVTKFLASSEEPPTEVASFAEELKQTANTIADEIEIINQAQRQHSDQSGSLASVLREWRTEYDDASHVNVDIDKDLDAVANGEDVTVTVTTKSSRLQVAKDKATFMSRQLQDEAGVTAEEDHDYTKTDTGYEWVLTLPIEQN